MLVDIAGLDAAIFAFYWNDIQSIKACLAQNEKAVFSDNINIEPLLDLQYAYNPNPLRATFFPVTRDTTMMFPNLQDGWLSLFHSTAATMKTRACHMKIMDDTKIINPANYFYYVDNAFERVIYTIKENHWMFYERGEPLSFENTAYYCNKRKKERLNKNIMLEYASSLGILENGTISLNTDNAFTYASFWEGEFAGSKGTGPTALLRKP